MDCVSLIQPQQHAEKHGTGLTEGIFGQNRVSELIKLGIIRRAVGEFAYSTLPCILHHPTIILFQFFALGCHELIEFRFPLR